MKKLLLLVLWLLATSASFKVNFEGPANAPLDASGNGISVHFRSGWARAFEGDFTNTPSGHAAAITRCAVDESLRVYVSPPIYHLRFKYTGCQILCDANFCYDGLRSFPIRVICYRPGGWWPVVAWQDFNEPGSAWETGCSGANYCSWHTAEMWFAEPVESFSVAWAIFGAAYIDDMEFDTARETTAATPLSWGKLKAIYR